MTNTFSVASLCGLLFMNSYQNCPLLSDLKKLRNQNVNEDILSIPNYLLTFFELKCVSADSEQFFIPLQYPCGWLSI